jgi:hypothetical protein
LNLLAILRAPCTEFVRVESYINDGKMFQREKKMKVEGVEGERAMKAEEGENITLYEHLDLHSNAHFSSFFFFWMILFRQWRCESLNV